MRTEQQAEETFGKAGNAAAKRLTADLAELMENKDITAEQAVSTCRLLHGIMAHFLETITRFYPVDWDKAWKPKTPASTDLVGVLKVKPSTDEEGNPRPWDAEDYKDDALAAVYNVRSTLLSACNAGVFDPHQLPMIFLELADTLQYGDLRKLAWAGHAYGKHYWFYFNEESGVPSLSYTPGELASIMNVSNGWVHLNEEELRTADRLMRVYMQEARRVSDISSLIGQFWKDLKNKVATTDPDAKDEPGDANYGEECPSDPGTGFGEYACSTEEAPTMECKPNAKDGDGDEQKS